MVLKSNKDKPTKKSFKTQPVIKKKGAMIGQATSKKMKEKLDNIKRRRDDDEVKSSDSHGTFEGDENLNDLRIK